MLPAERHRRILRLLEATGSVTTRELRTELQANAMMLWRDLRDLEEQGLLRRVRGGAMSLPSRREPHFDTKLAASRHAKQRLAAWVVKHLVRSGQIIICEGGTTVAEVASRLHQDRLTVLTNSLPVLNRLKLGRGAAVYASGGMLREESGTFIGPEAVRFFARRRADLFLMSATGLDVAAGPTDPNPQEIEVKQAMLRSARQTVLIADDSKFGQVSLMPITSFRRIDSLVTTARPPAALQQALRQSHCRLRVVAD